MDGKSLDINELKISQLREIFPEVFSENKIDFQRLKQSLGEDVFVKDEHYELSWAGKSEARKEIQKQTTATLIPDRENSIDFDNAQNIFIEGENLEVLRVLQKSYFGKIKMIYIDPPYNTGNDSFVYPDDYTERQDEYNKRTGITNEEGYLNKQDLWKKNTKENGQFHSVWLSMMYPRLYLSRNLLKEDGVIFVSIGEEEIQNLKLIMNEIFGEENFVNTLIVQRRIKNLNTQFDVTKTLNVGFEYILIYKKSNQFAFINPTKEANDSRKEGYWNSFWNNADRPTMRYEIEGVSIDKGQWKWSKERAFKALANYKMFEEQAQYEDLKEYWFAMKDKYEEVNDEKLEFIKKDGNTIKYWTTPSETTSLDTNLMDYYVNDDSGNRKFHFETTKNVTLIEKLIEIGCDENGIILDFFAGSGTTAAAVININNKTNSKRKFVLVQMPEVCKPESKAFQAGIYNYSDITLNRLKIEISKFMKSKSLFNENVGFRCFRISNSNHKEWDSNLTGKNLTLQLDLLRESLVANNYFNLVFELILKSGLPLTSVIKAIDNNSYMINNSCLFLYDKYNTETLDSLIENSNIKNIYCLDKLFLEDKIKTNLSLKLKEHNIKLITF